MVYDVIIIGGSSAGLSGALALGRALLKVACIDAGLPCNRFAHQSHSFLANDGVSPAEIKKTAKDQLTQYKTVEFIDDLTTKIEKKDNFFTAYLKSGKSLQGKKLLFASGVYDNMDKLGIRNIYQFWGNSIIHCPFCHGYEYAGKKTGIYYDKLATLSRQMQVIYNWSRSMSIFTTQDVLDALDNETKEKIKRLGIPTYVEKIVEAQGDGIQLKSVVLESGEKVELDVLYVEMPPELNNSETIKELGVELNEMGLIKVSQLQQTNLPEIYAAGDCNTPMRQISQATAQGGLAGAMMAVGIAQERWSAL